MLTNFQTFFVCIICNFKRLDRTGLPYMTSFFFFLALHGSKFQDAAGSGDLKSKNIRSGLQKT